jgi:DegV family protein with EDD domain
MSGDLPVAVVTDSTAYLPVDLVAEHRVTVVPLQVVIGGRALAEGLEVSSTQVAAALAASRPVTTSRPSPQSFAETYRRLAGAGAAQLASIHLSGDLSGTVDAARVAAREVGPEGIEVRVVDSRSVGMGLGFAVLAAARAAAAGATLETVGEVASRVAWGSAMWFYVDTLEYLRRGGRIGAAQAWLGSALSVKPLLHIVDGRLEALERVRTSVRALIRLEELAVADAGQREVDVAVHHLGAGGPAEELAQRLRTEIPGLRSFVLGEIGAVLGAHVGPGTVGVVVAPAG